MQQINESHVIVLISDRLHQDTMTMTYEVYNKCYGFMLTEDNHPLQEAITEYLTKFKKWDSDERVPKLDGEIEPLRIWFDRADDCGSFPFFIKFYTQSDDTDFEQPRLIGIISERGEIECCEVSEVIEWIKDDSDLHDLKKQYDDTIPEELKTILKRKGLEPQIVWVWSCA